MNPLFVVVLGFVGFLLLAHIPVAWVRFKRPGKTPADVTAWKRGWEKSDYLTVGLAALALIPAASDMTRAVESLDVQRALDGESEQHMQDVIGGGSGEALRDRKSVV